MIDFDYNDNQIVGYVDFTPATTHAKIEVVGYRDWKNVFHRLSEKDAIELFPPKGKVFAHNFADRFFHTKGTLVCIGVKENDKVGDFLDNYVWNKSLAVIEFGSRVKKINGSFTANGQFNYNILRDNNLLELEKDTFIICGGNIYLVKKDSNERLLQYWKPESLETIEVHGKLFVTDYYKYAEDGKIDITTDEQLMEWYLKNILKKNWSQIFEEKTFRNVEPLLRDAFSISKGLDGIVVGSRIKRLTHINRALTFSFDALNELKSLPWLKESIEQSINAHKEAFLKEVEVDKAKELKDLRDKYDLEIMLETERVENEKKELAKKLQEINNSIESKQKEVEDALRDRQLDLEIAEESLDKKKKEITTLEENIKRLDQKKDDIIEDFNIIKEVMGEAGSVSTQNLPVKKMIFEEISISDVDAPMYQAFIKSLENTLKANNTPHQPASEIGKQIARYKTLLVPDVAIAKMILMAIMRCRYAVEYVSATWKSFDDLWQNGLDSVIEECNKNENLMHFLILQNINLTYIPNYMMPLIDLQRGVISKFPGVDKRFPENLRILCTVTDDEVMPLNEMCLKYIGCIANSLKKDYYGNIVAPKETHTGYLTPKLLREESVLINNVPNNYKDYLVDE